MNYQILFQCKQQQPEVVESLRVKNISGVTRQLCLRGDLVKFNEALFPGCNPTI